MLADVERGIPSVIAAIIPDLRSVAVLLAPRGRLVCSNLDRPDTQTHRCCNSPASAGSRSQVRI
jgi:hypothetical protein